MVFMSLSTSLSSRLTVMMIACVFFQVFSRVGLGVVQTCEGADHGYPQWKFVLLSPKTIPESAQSYCRDNFQSDLASIRSAEEADDFLDFKNNKCMWEWDSTEQTAIGGQLAADCGAIEWKDGSADTGYRNWCDSMPELCDTRKDTAVTTTYITHCLSNFDSSELFRFALCNTAAHKTTTAQPTSTELPTTTKPTSTRWTTSGKPSTTTSLSTSTTALPTTTKVPTVDTSTTPLMDATTSGRPQTTLASSSWMPVATNSSAKSATNGTEASEWPTTTSDASDSNAAKGWVLIVFGVGVGVAVIALLANGYYLRTAVRGEREEVAECIQLEAVTSQQSAVVVIQAAAGQCQADGEQVTVGRDDSGEVKDALYKVAQMQRDAKDEGFGHVLADLRLANALLEEDVVEGMGVVGDTLGYESPAAAEEKAQEFVTAGGQLLDESQSSSY